MSDWPSLILFTADRMVSFCASDRRAYIIVESHFTPRKVVLSSGESTLFLAFSCNPNSFMWARTTSRCRTANWCGRTEVLDIGMLCPQKAWWSRSELEDLKWGATPHPSLELWNTVCKARFPCWSEVHILWPLSLTELSLLVPLPEPAGGPPRGKTPP